MSEDRLTPGDEQSPFEHTQRRANEAGTSPNPSIYRTLAEASSDRIWGLDSERRYTYCSPKAQGLLGYRPEELMGKTLFEFMPEDEAQRVENTFYAAIKERAPVVSLVSRHLHKDGREVMLESSCVPVFDDNGELTGLWGIDRDATERLRMEQALQESENILRSTFNSIPDLLSVHDRNLRIVLSNWHGHEYINEASQAQHPYCYHAYMHRDEPCELCHTRKVFETGRALRLEMRNPVDGKTREISAYPIFDKAGHLRYVVEHVRDVSERIQLEQQLRHSQKMEALGRLAGGVAHDLNNLLTPILGYTELFLDALDPETAEKSDLQQVLQAAERARALTGQLLAFGRRKALEKQKIDLKELIAGLQGMLQRMVPENIRLEIETPHPVYLLADPVQIEQILLNLVANGSDAMPDGGVLRVEISLATQPSHDAPSEKLSPPVRYLCLRVSDTGEGIGEAELERIFEPFFTTKTAGHGTGLGLSTVLGIVKQHGGQIDVKSELGSGTTFELRLPLVEAPSGDTTTGGKDTAAPLKGQEIILVVEDDPAVRSVAAAVLVQYGYHVMEAPDAEGALALADNPSQAIDLLLVDLLLPRLNGRELSERLTATRPQMRTIFMSGHTKDIISRQGPLASKAPFLRKPFTVRSLAMKVRKVLDT